MAQNLSTPGFERSIFAFNSLFHFVDKGRIGDTIDLHMVSFFEVRGRLGDSGRPLGVVREKQQSFAGLIQSAHWGNKRIALEAIEDRSPALLIRGSGYQPSRFVEHEVNFGVRTNGFSVHGNTVAFQVGSVLWISNNGAVY